MDDLVCRICKMYILYFVVMVLVDLIMEIGYFREKFFNVIGKCRIRRRVWSSIIRSESRG